MDKKARLAIVDDLIKLQTINGDEKLVADYLQKLFEDNGIKATQEKYDDNRSSLIATINPDADGPVLGFTGHEDVVDPVDP